MGLTKITSDGITDATIATADLADQSVSLAKLPHGTSSNDGKFLRANNGADPTFESVITDLVDDTSPQLGGALDTNGKNINFGDSTGGSADDRLVMGLGQDMAIYHDPSIGNLVKISSGDFLIRHYDEEMIVAKPNDAVELYHDNTKRFETSSIGATVTGHLTTTGEIFSGDDLAILDNKKITFGAGADLKIQSDGSNALILSDLLYINNSANSENMLKATANGAVELYHNNSKVLETMTQGVRITDNFLEIADTSCHLDLMENGSSNNHRIRQNAGNLYIQKLSDDKNTSTTQMLVDGGTGAVELYHDGTKQFETTSEGIHLPKGAIRGNSGTKVILGGTINPSQDKTWNFSFSTNAHGYNEGYVFAIKFYMNHWNHGNYWKYIEALRGGRGNVTGLNGHTQVNELGATASNWNNGHIDFEVTLSGGTMNGAGASLFKVKYDADGAPAWTSGYYLEVVHSAQIGTVSIT